RRRHRSVQGGEGRGEEPLIHGPAARRARVRQRRTVRSPGAPARRGLAEGEAPGRAQPEGPASPALQRGGRRGGSPGSMAARHAGHRRYRLGGPAPRADIRADTRGGREPAPRRGPELRRRVPLLIPSSIEAHVTTRQDKVSDLIKDEICRLLLREVRDPRIGFVTITGASASPDLRSVVVFVSVLGEPAAREGALKALNSAAGFFKRSLFHNLR